MALYADSAIPCWVEKFPFDDSVQVERVEPGPEKFRIRDGNIVRQMTDAERELYYPQDLEDAKRNKIAAIDSRTQELIQAGFSWGGNNFSMSDAAQRNWIGLGVMKANGLIQYPIPVGKVDEGMVLITTEQELISFLISFAQYQMDPNGPLGSGRALKALVEACMSVEEVNAIVDER